MSYKQPICGQCNRPMPDEQASKCDSCLEDDEKTITIEVEGGCVTDVSNLPEGWCYEINDLDEPEE